MLRSVLLSASTSEWLKLVITRAPVSRSAVRRFVAGETRAAALLAARALAAQGRRLAFEYLGPPSRDGVSAQRLIDEYAGLLADLAAADLAESADLYLSLPDVGLVFDPRSARRHARQLCELAADRGAAVVLLVADHTQVPAAIGLLDELLPEHPHTSFVVRAYLKRTERDVAELAGRGVRVRLTKGAYVEPESVAFETRQEIDLSFVRCLNLLLSGPGQSVIGTHDPRLITIARERAAWHDRARDSFEFQMLYGVAHGAAEGLIAQGYRVRVLVPYGPHWYGYFMRRLADRPATIISFARAALRRR